MLIKTFINLIFAELIISASTETFVAKNIYANSDISTLTNQVELETSKVFNLKKQLEGSSLIIPATRIKIFSSKFTPNLLEDLDCCSVSLSHLTARLSHIQRDEFSPELVSLYTTKGSWTSQVMKKDVNENKDQTLGVNNKVHA